MSSQIFKVPRYLTVSRWPRLQSTKHHHTTTLRPCQNEQANVTARVGYLHFLLMRVCRVCTSASSLTCHPIRRYGIPCPLSILLDAVLSPSSSSPDETNPLGGERRERSRAGEETYPPPTPYGFSLRCTEYCFSVASDPCGKSYMISPASPHPLCLPRDQIYCDGHHAESFSPPWLVGKKTNYHDKECVVPKSRGLWLPIPSLENQEG